jgi:hypothetical protein
MAKKKYLESPEKLLELWEEYKDSVGYDQIEQSTPKGEIVTLNIKRPFLKSGFEVFCFYKLGFGIGQYLDNQDKAYEEYLDVITCIRREWETDQVSGTLTGRFKAPNLTARLNNLKEQTDVTSNSEKIESISVTIVKPNED